MYMQLVILFLAHAASLDEICSRRGPSSAGCTRGDKLAIATKGMTKSMELLVASHAEKAKVNGSEDIFVSIKTTKKYHGTRLPPLVLTWLQTLQPEQVSMVILKLESFFVSFP